MKKYILIGLIFLLTNHGRSQVVINLQLPAMGLSIKSQLWNLSLINTTSADINAQIQVLITDVSNNQKILSGTTKTLTLPKGARQITANDVAPVTYNVLNPNYNLDQSQDGFLPVGVFDVCFTVMQFDHDAMEQLNEECEQVQIEPISPPMLVSPSDSEKLNVDRPLFNWMPPSPFILFNSLSYSYTLVEVAPTQSASNAIQQNVPLEQEQNMVSTNLQYPLSLPQLDTGKLYAWQITAYSNGLPISKSEIWTFSIQQLQTDTSQSSHASFYVSVQPQLSSSYTICKGVLRWSYRNDLGDKIIPFKVYDLTNAQTKEITLDSAFTDIRYGENFKELDFSQVNGFTDKHVYLLELINSRKEHWYLKFQYRNPD